MTRQAGHFKGDAAIQDAALSKYARAKLETTEPLGPTHAALLEYVPDESSVLDIGCSSGYLAAQLAQRGCRVVGVEVNHADAVAAREFCEFVIEGDVETLKLTEQLGGRTFDAILLGDVLEHLRTPESVLSGLHGLLRTDGCIAVSVPNVAHASIRLQLLLGGFWYTPVGLLDETHLRFFTLDTFTALADSAGFRVIDTTPIEEPINPDLFGQVVTQLGLGHDGAARLERFLSAPSAMTFQYVMKLVSSWADGTGPPVERPSWNRTLPEYLARRDEMIRDLQQQVSEQTTWALNAAQQVRERDALILDLQKRLAEQSAWAQASADEARRLDGIIQALQEQISSRGS